MRIALTACLLAGAGELFAQATGSYADPGICATCHPDIAKNYARTGMAQSFGSVRPDSDPRLSHDSAFDHQASSETFSVTTAGDAVRMERHQSGFDNAVTNVVQANIDYWFGSGDHARSFLSRTGRDELIELPLTWYSEKGGYFAMSPGYDSASHSGFTRKATYRCMFCHNAYPQMEPGADRMDSGTKFPKALPNGIDCQRCHGPGQAHVTAALAGQPAAELKTLIVNPAGLSAERRDEVCLQCHLEPTSTSLPAYLPVYGRGVFSYTAGEPLDRYIRYFDHAPGTGHDDKFEFTGAPYRLRRSECFKGSKGALTCITCHDPHQPDKAQATSRANAACVSCHSDRLAAFAATGDKRHSTSSQCASCHMPDRRPTDAIHVTITDHYIRSNPERSPEPVAEVNSGNMPPYRGVVVPYLLSPTLPSLTPEAAAGDLYAGTAQVKNRANPIAGMAALEKAIADTHPDNAEFYADLADAYRHSGNSKEAIPYYLDATRRDAGYWPAWHGLALAIAATGDLNGSLAPLRRAISISGGDSSVVRSLAAILSNMGKQNDAISALRAGIAGDPDSAELRNDLGTALFRTGDLAGAEKSAREAVRLKPESAAIRANFASILARRNRFDEARFEFQAAIRTEPGLVTARYNLAVMLELQHKLPEAVEQLAGAVRIDPAYYAAHLKLGEILIAEHKPAEALEHIRQAAASPDANLSRSASALLKGVAP